MAMIKPKAKSARQTPKRPQTPPQVAVQAHAPPQVPVQTHAPPQVPVQAHAPPQVPMQAQTPQLLVQAQTPQVPVQLQTPPQVPTQEQAAPQMPMQAQVAPQMPMQEQVAPQVPMQEQAAPQIPMQAQIAPEMQLPQATPPSEPPNVSSMSFTQLMQPLVPNVPETVPQFCIERERNLKRKLGYDYLLVTIDFQRDKKFGLGIVHTENYVLVNKVENDSMCSGRLQRLDRICDVEGYPVVNKEDCKKLIVNVLRRMLALIIDQPPSIVLEADVKQILMKYNTKLRKGSVKNAQSALAKKGERKKAQVKVNEKLETVHIGMDNELFQEELEKVPVKTYEMSPARLQNQNPPNGP